MIWNKTKTIKQPWEDNRAIKSVGQPTGAATKPIKSMQYTGDKMLGVATMHKSNAVPVFSDKEAKEVATMRRS